MHPQESAAGVGVASGLTPSELTDALSALESKGLVSVAPGEPRAYVAAAPDVAIGGRAQFSRSMPGIRSNPESKLRIRPMSWARMTATCSASLAETP